MADRHLPPPDLLRKILDYNPETGVLTWRERPPELFNASHRPAEIEARIWNGRFAGKPALASKRNGYLCGNLFGRSVRANRAAWAWMTGCWPDHVIDHANGVKTDNRWRNLREVTQAINARNCSMSINNTSGHNGVSWDSRDRRWRAEIKINGTRVWSGRFGDPVEAAAARKDAERRFGYTARHGLSPDVKR